MPNSFSKYTGGIQGVSGILEAGANIANYTYKGLAGFGQSLAEGLVEYNKNVALNEQSLASIQASGGRMKKMLEMFGDLPEYAPFAAQYTDMMDRAIKAPTMSLNQRLALANELEASQKNFANDLQMYEFGKQKRIEAMAYRGVSEGVTEGETVIGGTNVTMPLAFDVTKNVASQIDAMRDLYAQKTKGLPRAPLFDVFLVQNADKIKASIQAQQAHEGLKTATIAQFDGYVGARKQTASAVMDTISKASTFEKGQSILDYGQNLLKGVGSAVSQMSKTEEEQMAKPSPYETTKASIDPKSAELPEGFDKLPEQQKADLLAKQKEARAFYSEQTSKENKPIEFKIDLGNGMASKESYRTKDALLTAMKERKPELLASAVTGYYESLIAEGSTEENARSQINTLILGKDYKIPTDFRELPIPDGYSGEEAKKHIRAWADYAAGKRSAPKQGSPEMIYRDAAIEADKERKVYKKIAEGDSTALVAWAAGLGITAKIIGAENFEKLMAGAKRAADKGYAEFKQYRMNNLRSAIAEVGGRTYGYSSKLNKSVAEVQRLADDELAKRGLTRKTASKEVIEGIEASIKKNLFRFSGITGSAAERGTWISSMAGLDKIGQASQRIISSLAPKTPLGRGVLGLGALAGYGGVSYLSEDGTQRGDVKRQVEFMLSKDGYDKNVSELERERIAAEEAAKSTKAEIAAAVNLFAGKKGSETAQPQKTGIPLPEIKQGGPSIKLGAQNAFLGREAVMGSMPEAMKREKLREYVSKKLGFGGSSVDAVMNNMFRSNEPVIREITTPSGARVVVMAGPDGKWTQLNVGADGKGFGSYGTQTATGAWIPQTYSVGKKGRTISIAGNFAGPTKESFVEFQRGLADYMDGITAAEDLKDIIGITGKSLPWNVDVQARAAGLVARIKAAVRISTLGTGAISDYEQKLLDDVIQDPTKFFTMDSANRARIEGIFDKLDSHLVNQGRIWGLDVRVGTGGNQNQEIESSLRAIHGSTGR
jgi:hypothetical protein